MGKYVKVVDVKTLKRKALLLPENFTGAEVDVYDGKNSLSLLTHIPWLKKLYCIDRWEEYEGYKNKDNDFNCPDNYNVMEDAFKVFNKNISFFKSKVEVLKMDSFEASKHIEDCSLDFVFIDGNHDYEYVKRDILAYLPKVKIGGILSGHDYIQFKGEPAQRYEVKKVVDELFKNKSIVGSIWMVEVGELNNGKK